MRQPVKLRKAQAWPIVGQVFPEYKGRTFKLLFCQSVTFYDVHWGGGTRNVYRFVRADGETAYLSVGAPWDSPWEGLMRDIPPEVLVVEHAMFCGKDMGIRIYAHPCWAPRLLPEFLPKNSEV